MWTCGSIQSARSKGRQPACDVLHSSYEPGELSQCQPYDNIAINIVVAITNIIAMIVVCVIVVVLVR